MNTRQTKKFEDDLDLSITPTASKSSNVASSAAPTTSKSTSSKVASSKIASSATASSKVASSTKTVKAVDALTDILLKTPSGDRRNKDAQMDDNEYYNEEFNTCYGEDYYRQHMDIGAHHQDQNIENKFDLIAQNWEERANALDKKFKVLLLALNLQYKRVVSTTNNISQLLT